MDNPSLGLKGNKKWLTYAFMANADESEKLPTFVIGKAAHPHAFNKKTGKQLGFYYQSNAKAWMTPCFTRSFFTTGTVNCKHKAGIFCCFRITSVVILFPMASQHFC